MNKEKKASLIQTTCAYCGVGCGLDVTVDNGKALSVCGTSEHPANYGKLCVKGSNLLTTTNLSNRQLFPEIAGNKVSWQQATSYVADGFSHIIKKYGKDAVAFYVSGQLLTEDYYVANKLMKGYIGSGNIDTNSRLCMSSAVSAYKRAFGEDVVPCNYEDLEKTDLLLLTGSNAAWTHPILFQRIERAKKINPSLKVVVIDPRKTASCQIADIFLPLKAGSDTAFFNGLLHYLHKNNGLNHEYITKHTENFTATLAATSQWTVSAVAQFCQLKLNDLRKVYKLFCQSKTVVTMYSMGINQSSSGVDKCQSIINCHLASGKIAKQGCGPFSITGQPNAMGGREVGGLANQLTAHMDITNPQQQAIVQKFWQSPTIATKEGAKAVDLFEQIANGNIKAVWIMATNPMVSLPNRDKIAQALQQCELVVVSDCVANNDTLDFAKVKFPATTWLEKNGTVTNSERRISRQRNVELPAGEAKHDWQIISEVAKKMGFNGFNFTSAHEIFNEYVQLTGFENNGERILDLSALINLSECEYNNLKPMQWPINNIYPEGCSRVFADGKFNTPSGKAKFYAITPQLPIQQTSTEFPFVLNSGRIRDHWHSMTRTGKSDKLTAHIEKPYLYIHPEDAAMLALSNEDLVTIRAKTGSTIVHIKIDKNQRQGECFMPIHWNKQYASHANVSCLYQSVVDPISGQAETKHGAVSLSKKNFAQYIHMSCLEDININADFWLKNKVNYGVSYQIALKEVVTDTMRWAQQASRATGEWLQFHQGEQLFIICINNKKLQCVVYFSNIWHKVEPAWLTHVFAQQSLNFSTIQSLLQGVSSDEFYQGKQICSCFSVGEKAIETAIKQGCTSVEQLGARLQCGTNCGSCKGDIANLIEHFIPVLLVD
jgi:assimilatory nitrate reductase catalytic subunit